MNKWILAIGLCAASTVGFAATSTSAVTPGQISLALTGG